MLFPKHLLLVILLVTSTTAAPLRPDQRLAQSQVAVSSNGGPGVSDGVSATDLSGGALDNAQDGESGGATAQLDRRMPATHPYTKRPTPRPPVGPSVGPSGQTQVDASDDEWSAFGPRVDYRKLFQPNKDKPILHSTVTEDPSRKISDEIVAADMKREGYSNGPGKPKDYGNWMLLNTPPETPGRPVAKPPGSSAHPLAKPLTPPASSSA